MAKKRKNDAELMRESLQGIDYGALNKSSSVPQAQNAGIPDAMGQPQSGEPQLSAQGQGVAAISPTSGFIENTLAEIWKQTKTAAKQAYDSPVSNIKALIPSIVGEFAKVGPELQNMSTDAFWGTVERAKILMDGGVDLSPSEIQKYNKDGVFDESEMKLKKRDDLVNKALIPHHDWKYMANENMLEDIASKPDAKGNPTGWDAKFGVSSKDVAGKSIGNVAALAMGGLLGRAAKLPMLADAFMYNMEFNGYLDDIKSKRGGATVSDPLTMLSAATYAKVATYMEKNMGLNPNEIGAGKTSRDAIRRGILDAAEDVTAESFGSSAAGLNLAGRLVKNVFGEGAAKIASIPLKYAGNVGGDAAQEVLQQVSSDVIKSGQEYLSQGSTDNPMEGIFSDPLKRAAYASKLAENAVGAFFGSGVMSAVHMASGGERQANNAAYDYIRNGNGDLRSAGQQFIGQFVPSVLSSDGEKGITARADLVKKTAVNGANEAIKKIQESNLSDDQKVVETQKLEESRDKAISNIDGIANLAINVPSRVGESGSFQAFQILEKQKALKDLIKVDEAQLSDPTLNNAVGQLNDSDIKAREELMGIYDKQLKEIGKDGATTIDKKEQALLRQVGLSEYAEPLLDKKDSKVEGIVNEGLLLNDETSFVAPNGKTFVKDNGQWVGLEKISEADSIDNVDPVTGVKTKEAIPAKYRVDQKFDATDKQDNIQAAYEASGSAKRVQGEVDAETRRIEQEELKKEQDAKAELDKQIKETNDELVRIKKEKNDAQNAELKELRIESARLTNEAKRAGIKAKEKAALEKEAKAKNDEAAAIESAEYKKDEREIKYEKLLQDLYNAQDLAVKKIDEVQSRINVNEEKLETQRAKTEQVKQKAEQDKDSKGNKIIQEAAKDKAFRAFFNKLEKHIIYPLFAQNVTWSEYREPSLESDQSGEFAFVEINGKSYSLPYTIEGGERVYKYKLAKGIDKQSKEDVAHYEDEDGEIRYNGPDGSIARHRQPGVRIRIANSSLIDGEQQGTKSPDLAKRKRILVGIGKAFDSGSGSPLVAEAITLLYNNFKKGLVSINAGDVAHLENMFVGQKEVWSGEIDAQILDMFDAGMDISSREYEFKQLAKDSGLDELDADAMTAEIKELGYIDDNIEEAQLVRDIVFKYVFDANKGNIRVLKNRQLNEKSARVDGKAGETQSESGSKVEGNNSENTSGQQEQTATETQANGEGAAVAEKPSTETTKSAESGGRNAGTGKTGTTKGAKTTKDNDVEGKSDKTLFDGEPISVRHAIMKRLAYGNIGIIRKGVQDLFKTQNGKDFSSDTTRMGFLWQEGKQLFDTIDALADAIFEADESDGFAFGSIDDYRAEIDDVLKSWNIKDYRKQIADEIRAASIMPDWMVDQAEYEYEQEKRDEESLSNSPYSGISYGDTQAPFSIDDYLKQIGDIINEGDQGIAFSPEKEADRIYRLTLAVKDLALALIKEGIATINNVIKEVSKRVKVDKSVLDAAQEQLDVQFSASSLLAPNGKKSNLTPVQSDSIEQVKKLAAKMSGKFKGSKIKFFTDKDRNIDGIQLKVGEKVWGIKASDGTIYLNLDGISFEAAIHEFSHLWEAVYPSKFFEGVSLLKNTDEGKKLFNELRNNKSYDNLTDAQIWREALNTAIGRKGQDLFKGTKLMRFKDYLKSFFRGVAEKLLGGKFTVTPDMKLKDFLNLAVGDITNKGGNYGKRVSERIYKEEEQGAGRSGKNNATESIVDGGLFEATPDVQFNAAMAFGDGRFESGTEVDLGLDPSQNLVEQLVQTDWSDMLEKDNFDQLFDNFVAPIHEDISGEGNAVWQEILGNEDLRELVRAEIIDESSEKEIVDKVSKIGTKDDAEVGKKIKEVAKQLRDNTFFKSEIPNMSPYVYYDEIENKFYKIDAKKEAALVKKSGVFVGAIARLMGSSKQLDTILLGLQEPGGFLSKIRVMMQGEALDRKDKVKDRLKKKLMALIDKFPELTNQTTERPITFDGVTINLSEAFSLFLQDERVLRETGSRFIGGLKTFQDVKGDTHPLNDYQAFYDALEAGMKKYGKNTLAAAKADFESFFNDSVVKENMRPAMLVTQGITDFKLGVPIIEAADDRPFLMASFSPGTPKAASGKVEGKVLHSLPLNEVMANHMSQVENFIEAAEYTHHVEQWNKKYGKSAYEFKSNPNAGMAQKLKDAVSSKLLKNAFPESLDSRIKNVGGTGKLKTLKFLQFLSNSMSRSQFALNLSSGAIQSLGIVSLAVAPMRRGSGKAIVQFFKKSATSIGPVFEALANIANNKKYERMTRHDVEDYLNASWLPFKKLGWADTVAEMKKHSPYLYGRLNNSFFEINEILRDSSEIRGNYKNKQAEALNRLGRNLSINQTVGDIGVIIAEWQMSKKEYMNNPITVPYNGSKIVLKGFEAVAFAAKANVQATQVVHDMSQMTNLKMAAQRGDQVAQLISAMFPFITENLKRMNMAAFYAMQKEAPAGFTNAQWQMKRKLAFPTAMAAMTIGYKLLSGLWSSLRFDCGTEKMDEVFDRVLSVPKTGIQTTDLLTNMVGAPPILGQLSYQMKGLDTKTVKKYGDDYEWGEFGKSFHPTDVVADLVTIGYAKKIEKELMDDTRDGSLDAEEYGMWAVEAASALAGIPKTLLAIADCFRR